ncbi:MAG: ABC transporter permease [Firmicutes bacterium]|nr:ABC transporter permease [Bacillota bacterium]
MTHYIVRRVLWMFVAVFFVNAITYFVAFGIPPDPARMIAGQHATAATVAAVARALHLNLPIWQRFLLYLWGVAHGNLGYSYVYNRPVLSMIQQAAPVTAALAVAAILAELVIGVPVGIIAAYRRGSRLDAALMVGSLVGISMPTYWLGVLLILFLGYMAGLFPLSGYSLRGLVLPALAVGITGAAFYARLLRSTMLEVMGLDYVRTARAKGMSERGVLFRHVVRNALIPFVTQMGIDFSTLLGGLIVTEVVFGIPGLGLLANQAIGNLDPTVIVGETTYTATAVVVVNLLVDIVYAFLDPRISYR